jgi:hypothetical protein
MKYSLRCQSRKLLVGSWKLLIGGWREPIRIAAKILSFRHTNSQPTSPTPNQQLGVYTMSHIQFWVAAVILGLGCLFIPLAHSQPVVGKAKPTPKLEPVAETKLLMDGLADPNLRGLGKLLREKPKEAEAWNFARGQALLIGETGNLLMMGRMHG